MDIESMMRQENDDARIHSVRDGHHTMRIGWTDICNPSIEMMNGQV